VACEDKTIRCPDCGEDIPARVQWSQRPRPYLATAVRDLILVAHWKLHCPSPKNKEKRDPFAHWDGKTQCPYCPQRFNSLAELDHHAATHETGRF
jgi:hypothetical protein